MRVIGIIHGTIDINADFIDNLDQRILQSQEMLFFWDLLEAGVGGERKNIKSG